MIGTITRTYAPTNCDRCRRACGQRSPVTIIAGTAGGHADGTYCRSCTGIVTIDLISAAAGLDAPIILAEPHEVIS